MKLADVPNMIKIAGPIQQEAAKNEAKIVPILEMFSVFIAVHHSYLVPPTNDSLRYCATYGRIKWLIRS